MSFVQRFKKTEAQKIEESSQKKELELYLI